MTVDRVQECRGFSLLEAAFAVSVVSILLAGVVPLIAQASRVAAHARTQTMTAVFAAARMEQLLALPWAFIETPGGTLEALSDFSTDLANEVPSTGGAGLSATPAATLLSNAAGHADFLDAQGVWIGAGIEYPPGAAYVRRWAVTPLPGDPETLVFRVVVAPAIADRLAQPRSGAMVPGETWLDSVRTRTRQ